MQSTGNTILVTGGGSGIGQALAAAFHERGNTVIVAGRRQSALAETVKAYPGMSSMILDIEDPVSIAAMATTLESEHPTLNVIIHNAGIMRPENLLAGELADAEAMVATNLLGPIRLTAALLPQLLKQPKAAILTVSSGLAFVPLAATPTYCATKAAIHSYTQSLRHQLRETRIAVHELVPPYVQTELMGPDQARDPKALPLADFIAETMQLLQDHPDAKEILVERVKPLRRAEIDGHFDHVFGMLNGGAH